MTNNLSDKINTIIFLVIKKMIAKSLIFSIIIKLSKKKKKKRKTIAVRIIKRAGYIAQLVKKSSIESILYILVQTLKGANLKYIPSQSYTRQYSENKK